MKIDEGSNAPNLAWCTTHRVIQRCHHNRLAIYLTLMVQLNISQHSSLTSSPPYLSHSSILHHHLLVSSTMNNPHCHLMQHLQPPLLLTIIALHRLVKPTHLSRISSFSRPLVAQVPPHTEYWWGHNRTDRTMFEPSSQAPRIPQEFTILIIHNILYNEY